jgi:hypothetical protein
MSNYLVEDGRIFYFEDCFFNKPQPISAADASSFEVIDKWFARDSRNVYFLYRPIDDADPVTFTYLGGYNDYWAKDRARAYFWPTKAARQYRALPSNSLDLFAILPSARLCEYAGDAACVYYRGRKIRGADAASFRVMLQEEWEDPSDRRSLHFARDKSRIYFDGQPIKQADLDTFVVLHEPGLGHTEFGVDVRSAYFKSQRNGKIAQIAHNDLPAPVRERFRRRVTPE